MPNIVLEKPLDENLKPLKEGNNTLPFEVSNDSVRVRNLKGNIDSIEGEVTFDGLSVGVQDTKWSDGWNGYKGYIFFTPTDFANTTISNLGRSSAAYNTPIDLSSATPSWGVMSGTGDFGVPFVGNANGDLVAMAVIPSGFMATGSQCWATDGGAGSQPTYRVGYKNIGFEGDLTYCHTGNPDASNPDASVSVTSFDQNGDNGNNDVYSNASGNPRMIVMNLLKAHANDIVWGGAISIQRM